MTERILEKFNKKHEELIINVLTQAGIPKEEYKNVTRFVPKENSGNDYYFLAYNNLKLGRVDIDYVACMIYFTPDPDLAGEAVKDGKIQF